MFHKSQNEKDPADISPKHLFFYFALSGNGAVQKKLTLEIDYRALETLNLAHTNIDDAIIDTLITRLINSRGSVLKELNLGGNNFTDEGIAKFLEAIEKSAHCQLQKLCITGNPLSPAMLQQVEETFLQRKVAALQFR